MQERRMAKSKGQHHEDYKKKAREVKQIIRRDKKKYIEDKCEQIENNFSKKRSRDAYNIITSLIRFGFLLLVRSRFHPNVITCNFKQCTHRQV